MNKRATSFTCEANDWHFARAYSHAGVPHAIAMPIEKKGMSWLALPSLLFLAGIVGSIVYMHIVWIVVIVLSLLMLLFNYQRQSKVRDEQYVSLYEFAEQTEQHIPFVSLTNEHLNLHLFKPDGSISHQLKINEIEAIAITMLNLTARSQHLPYLINKHAEKLGKPTVPLLYGRTQVYQITVYTKRVAQLQSIITIPEAWLKSDTFARLIEAIQHIETTTIKIEDTTEKNSLIKQYCEHYGVQLPFKRR